MEKFLNQFRRLAYDNGASDKNFAEQEQKLKDAQTRLAEATNELIKSSDRLNAVALTAYYGSGLSIKH